MGVGGGSGGIRRVAGLPHTPIINLFGIPIRIGRRVPKNDRMGTQI